MRLFLRGTIGLGLIAVGYILGTSGILESTSAQAQPPTIQGVSKETQEKIKAAHEALVAAKDALQAEGRYRPVTDPELINAFGILSGGLDAIGDLESGRGVDPETFAALYADLAAGDVRADIDRDAQGRLTYKNKVIRLYPISRLKQEFANRNQLADIEEK